MPKQIYNIRAFHGGLNSNSDARDIAENELSDAQDVMVDKVGEVTLMGKTSTSGVAAANAAIITDGYGLFAFSHDRLEGEAPSGAAAETGDHYLALADPKASSGAQDIDIHSEVQRVASGTEWGTAEFSLGNTSGMKAVYYIVDGNLRVADANFANTNKWYGYIKRTHFNGITPGGAADSYDSWYSKDAEIKLPNDVCLEGKLTGTADASGSGILLNTDSVYLAPSSVSDSILEGKIVVNKSGNEELTLGANGKQDQDELNTPAIAEGATWDSKGWALFPKAGDGFHVHIEAPGSSGGLIPSGNYEIGISYIYDAEPGFSGAQESIVRRCRGGGPDASSLTIDTGEIISSMQIFATSPYDPRLTGGRVYWRIVSAGDGSDWKHLFDISLKNGIRQGLFGQYEGWSIFDSGISNSICVSATSDEINSVSSVTWEDLNGMPQDTSTITAFYKTAVVTNRMVYIGNVNYNGDTYGDAVFKSPVNKFDIFTDARKLEIAVSDGDQIVKLESYADRLLIYKQNKLEILNISQEQEFVEDTIMYKGVSHPASVFKTDFGIVWANEEGCYLYDGQKVNNLLEKGGRQIIKESDWASFAFTPMVGYIPKKRQIIVLDDVGNAGSGHIYLYDLVTKSWVKGSVSYPDAGKTNFVVNSNGDLILSHTSGTGTVVKWDDVSETSTAMIMQTRDVDFGQPGVRKKIYKVYITYKGDARNVQVQYGVDGLAPALNFFTITSGTNGSTTGGGAAAKCLKDASTNDWLKAELKPAVSINNVNSFQLKLSGDGSAAIAADFEIDSISIVYRTKGIK